MTDPRDLQLSSYDYRLADERIAQSPVEPRHSARLLMAPSPSRPAKAAMHRQVWDWQEELRPGDLLVVNDTRVLRARLRVRRSGGGLAELLVLEPRGEGCWLCLARPGKNRTGASQGPPTGAWPSLARPGRNRTGASQGPPTGAWPRLARPGLIWSGLA